MALFKLVAGDDDTLVARDVDQYRALHQELDVVALEKNERAVAGDGNIARDLPSVSEQLFDGQGLLGCNGSGHCPDQRKQQRTWSSVATHLVFSTTAKCLPPLESYSLAIALGLRVALLHHRRRRPRPGIRTNPHRAG